MPLTKRDAAWNKEVSREVKPILKAKKWLSSIKKYEELSWEDEARVDRAQSLLDLALTEIYSTMYRTDKEISLYKQREIST
jgi:hypothetical protein